MVAPARSPASAPVPDGAGPPVWFVNAFTRRADGGNPAAVVWLERPAPVAWMQAAAAQHNLSETAFVRPLDAAEAAVHGADHGLRWFTPTSEIPLCGHATLATAVALADHGRPGPYRFATASGVLVVTAAGDAGGAGAGGDAATPTFTLDFPANPPEPLDGCATTALLEASLGLPAGERAVRGVAAAGSFWLVELDSAARVAAVDPDGARLMALPAHEVIVTAPGDGRPLADAAGRAAACVSRVFCPRLGILEDPVTGAAHCALGPYWAARLGQTRLLAEQRSARGGVLWLDTATPGRARLTGTARLWARGRLADPVPAPFSSPAA